MKDDQKSFYQKQWKGMDFDETPSHSGWRSTIPASDFLNFVQNLERFDISNGKALDLGCGNGRHSIILSKNGFETYGLDFSKNAIKLAKRNAARHNIDTIKFNVGDALDLPYKSDFFDLVNDDGCLHHINPKAWTKYVENVARVIKRGGILRVKVFSNNSRNDATLNCNGRWVFSKSSGYTYFFDKAEIQILFVEKFDFLELKEISHDIAHDKKFFSAVMKKR